MSLSESVLLLLSRSVESPDFGGGTSGYTLDNALNYHRKTVPDFDRLVHGKRILDYGCGPGWQAVAMALLGASSVVGVDIHGPWLEQARELAERTGVTDRVRFTDTPPVDTFDIALSSNSFEHFSDPAAVLDTMARSVHNEGRVIITFAEPWYSPRGSHMTFFTRVPWVNLLFTERTVMKVRSQFRDDGARFYEEVSSGLNRMTLAKFERIIRASEMRVEFQRYYPVKRLPLVDKVPILRELLVGAVSCILRKGAE